MDYLKLTLIGAFLLIAAFLLGGLFDLSPVNSGNNVGVFVVNRITGDVRFCGVTGCFDPPSLGAK